MNLHDANNNNSVGRRPGGLWSLGTTGCLVGLLYLAVALARRLKGECVVENTETSARTLLVLDTAASSKDLTVRVGPGHPLVRLPESDTYMITPRKISHLAERALAHKSTRRYGEKLRRLPDGSTEGGAGGFPVVALTAGLIEAHEDVAALHLMENLQILFDDEAKKLSDAWFAEYRDSIKTLPHDRQDAYRQIIALSTEPQDVDLVRPVSRVERTKVREKDGTETDIPTYGQHLLCDEQGSYPAELGQWEKAVLLAETHREGFQFWYRNPDRPSQDSLGIAYAADDDTRIVRPDFIFFAEQDGEIVADIIDPHGFHLADALPKLQGLARYAEKHSRIYRRIEAVAVTGGKLRVLDLTLADVRQAIMDGKSAEALYKNAVASDYA